MGKINVQLDGVKEFRRVLRNLDRLMLHALAQEITTEAEAIMLRSKSDFVPVDLGTLRSSGQVFDVETKGTTVAIELGFGGAASAYALAVHEGTGPPSWEGKQIVFSPHGDTHPKYLERPTMDAGKGMAARMGKRAKPRIERLARRLGR